MTGRPSNERAEHLFQVHTSMLFLQGTRDKLADAKLMQELVERLAERATLKLLPDADHSFHIPVRSGSNDAQVREEMLDALAGWIEGLGLGGDVACV